MLFVSIGYKGNLLIKLFFMYIMDNNWSLRISINIGKVSPVTGKLWDRETWLLTRGLRDLNN